LRLCHRLVGDVAGIVHLRPISVTEAVNSSVAEATDCTLLDASSDALATALARFWVLSAVLVSVSAAASSSVADDDTLCTMLPTAASNPSASLFISTLRRRAAIVVLTNAPVSTIARTAATTIQVVMTVRLVLAVKSSVPLAMLASILTNIALDPSMMAVTTGAIRPLMISKALSFSFLRANSMAGLAAASTSLIWLSSAAISRCRAGSFSRMVLPNCSALDPLCEFRRGGAHADFRGVGDDAVGKGLV
jgi:hypothetical protein